MEYKDFNIRIMSKKGDGYEVKVDSPAGGGSAHIKMPFDIEEAARHVRDMGGNVRGGGTREVEFEATETMSPADFGSKLYSALFSGAVGKMYNRSYAALMENPEVGLRIKLHLNLEDPEVSELAQIPWEYVYEADTMEYLTLSRQTPIVRYIEVQRGLTTQHLKNDLRILVVMSSPNGVAELDLEKEKKLIEETWANEENVSVDFLEHPTPETLRMALTQKRYHVLHYMGHGAYDEKTGAGALILEDANHDALMFDPQTLATFLRNAQTIRLVFLNACDTAKSDEDEPFAGVANRLVMAGVPAVLAMQFPITDDAAIDFSRAFYSQLVNGFPVDEATAQGRAAILAGKAGTIEWGTPVLYMRAPDGILFDRDLSRDEEVAPAPAPSPVGGGEPPIQPIPPAEPPKPNGGGMSGRTEKIVGGIVALAVIIAGAIWWFTRDTGDFKWDPEEIVLEVGVPTDVKLLIAKSDEENAQRLNFNEKYVIELEGDSAVTVAERPRDDRWEWVVIATDLPDSGAGELEADISLRDTGKPVDQFDKAVTITINADAQREHQAAIDAFGGETSGDDQTVADYLKAKAQLPYMSASMKEELDTALNDFMNSVRQAADAASGDQNVVVSERIAAIVHWLDVHKQVRELAPAESDPLVQRMDELEDLPELSVIACDTYNGCGDTSIDSVRTNSNVFVRTEPEVSGLRCMLISDSQERECHDILNEGNARYLTYSEEYRLEIRNGQGDLLARETIQAR